VRPQSADRAITNGLLKLQAGATLNKRWLYAAFWHGFWKQVYHACVGSVY
jgi:hypothetical protein